MSPEQCDRTALDVDTRSDLGIRTGAAGDLG